MKRKFTALALCGALICCIPALAAGTVSPEEGGGKDIQPLPDSCLYYGEVKSLLKNEDGTLSGLQMDSQQFGEYIMHVSGETFWIDCENRTVSDPTTLKEGEELYVFRSPVTALSLPPQSAAFAVVRNTPQGAGGAHYHKVEALEKTDGQLRITTDQGSLYLFVGEETTLSAYTGDAPETLDGLRPGDYVMAWYGAVARSYPGQARVQHLMTLNRPSQPLTRSAFAVLLHTAQGSPAVDFAVDYTDVDPDADYMDALRWAASEKLISGYGDGRVGPGDVLSREQMVVILWRWAGSPMLMDYPGLTQYGEAGDIAPFARSALAWAHQKGLLPAGEVLGPKDTVTQAEAESMLLTLGSRES